MRLGAFLDGSQVPWQDWQPVLKGRLTAKVFSGTRWVDFPGAYASARFIASERAFSVLKSLQACSSLSWARTSVTDGSGESRQFWTLVTHGAKFYHTLDERGLASTFNPVFRFRKDAEIPPFDFALDASHEILVSDRMCNAMLAANLSAFSYRDILPSV